MRREDRRRGGEGGGFLREKEGGERIERKGKGEIGEWGRRGKEDRGPKQKGGKGEEKKRRREREKKEGGWVNSLKNSLLECSRFKK